MNLLNFVVYPAMVILFGLVAAFSFLKKEHKYALLSSNSDGREPLSIGLGFIALGAIATLLDYTAARMLLGIGFTLVALGSAILADDYFTDNLFQPVLGTVYAVLAILAYSAGAVGGLAFNGHAFVNLALPVAFATLLATVSALSLTSEVFKSRLDQQKGGVLFIALGVVLVILSPLTLNPVLIIASSCLGALLFTLGLLIAVDQDDVLKALSTKKVPVYALFTLGLLIGARLFY